MSVTVWKFRLGNDSGPAETYMPRGARIRHVAADPALTDGTIAVWAEVEDTAPRELRAFHLSVTGGPVMPGMDFVGTVVGADGFVLHVWILPAG